MGAAWCGTAVAGEGAATTAGAPVPPTVFVRPVAAPGAPGVVDLVDGAWELAWELPDLCFDPFLWLLPSLPSAEAGVTSAAAAAAAGART